jgi:hypothetical protein
VPGCWVSQLPLRHCLSWWGILHLSIFHSIPSITAVGSAASFEIAAKAHALLPLVQGELL